MDNDDLQNIIDDERDNPISDMVIEKVRKCLEGRSMTERGIIRATHLKDLTVTKAITTLVGEKKARCVMVSNKTGPDTTYFSLIAPDPEVERQKEERARQYRLKVALGL